MATKAAPVQAAPAAEIREPTLTQLVDARCAVG